MRERREREKGAHEEGGTRERREREKGAHEEGGTRERST
jgi:hypothetical protein